MSRAFNPPDTLSQDNIRTVADVRRTVWINGIFGLGAGSVTGMMSHIILQKLQRHYIGDEVASDSSKIPRKNTGKESGFMYRCLRPLPPLGKNTFLLSLLGGGALGSFVMSTTAGKNAVHLLHPIFQVGRDEHAGKSPYQIAMANAQKQQLTGDSSSEQRTKDVDELDADHHRIRSLRRSQSIKRRLESGQSLSDTHGNTWPYSDSSEETEEAQKDRAMYRAREWGRRQTLRKEWVQDKISKGRALSDSTGGHWAEDESGEKEDK
ncbi:hypothetical protein ACHAXS_004219 [Conticribra weissflogii]